MALNQTALKVTILSMLNTALQETESTTNALDQFANDLSGLIVDEIKKATITLPIGTVNVTGPGGASSNVVPLVYNNAIT